MPIRALIKNPATGASILTAAVSSVTVKVHNLLTEVETSSVSPSAGSVMFDTLQTGNGWNYTEGYNFRYVVPGTAFPDGNSNYLITLLALDTSSNTIRHQWTHRTTEVFGE